MKGKVVLASISCVLAFSFNGCSDLISSTTKMTESSPLKVETNMSDSIFIDPVAKNKKTVFIFAKNTSSCNLNLENKITEGIKSKGYTIVEEPDDATFILSANVLECAAKTAQELKAEALSTIKTLV